MVIQGDTVPGSISAKLPNKVGNRDRKRDILTASSFIDSHASRLGVNASRRGEAITLRLSGEADMASSEEIARCLSSLRLTGGVAVRLEVTALRFADAATVSALGAFARTAQSHGHPISTCGASTLFRRIAELLGLTDALGLSTSPAGHQIPSPPSTSPADG